MARASSAFAAVTSTANRTRRRFPHRDLTEKSTGTFYDASTARGCGFLGSVYHKAVPITLADAGLCAESEVKLFVYFRGPEVSAFEVDI